MKLRLWWGAVIVIVAATGGARPRAQARPSLAVVIVVDQLRADYVDRFRHQWTEGLHRLLDGGAVFVNAAYPYLNTVTCAGHATVATGTYPATHGMIANSWWDRELERSVRCTFDPDHPVISYGAPIEGGESAHRLRAPTLADELRRQLPRAPRIVSLSPKQRSAISMAGQRGDVVSWLEDDRTWVTSTAFAERPIAFLATLLADYPIERALGERWLRSLPASRYLYEDAVASERPPARWSTSFPHAIEGEGGEADDQFFTRWSRSPLADDYLGLMAQSAVVALELGQRDAVDFLGLGFSTLDHVGHRFGPHSHEVQDVLIRLDRTIGALLEMLDREVGPDRYVVALTADHGVGPIPERAVTEGMDAGRLSGRSLVAGVDAALEPFLGAGPHIERVMGNDLYFAPGVYEELKRRPRALEAAIRALEATPGIARVFHGDRLTRETRDSVERAAALSYHPGRSGDLILISKPYWISGGNAATHGTANWYDRRVPLLLYGAGVQSGRYRAEATPADIAPTLGHVVGVGMTEAEGRVLREAVRTPQIP